MSEYYVYAYLDPSFKITSSFCDITFDHIPIYIGKGINNRMYDHLKDRKRFKTMFYNKINKMIRNNIQPLIVVIKKFENESDAFEFEKLLICEIKNIKNGGTLYNSTNGGEGIPGYKFTVEKRREIRERCINEKSHLRFPNTSGENHPMYGKKHSIESKKKMSIKQKNKKLSEETKRKISECNKGKKISDEHKEKISKFHKGRKPSQETRNKMSAAKKGYKPWNYNSIKDIILQIDKDGNTIREWTSLIELENNGYQKSNIIHVCNGKRKSHKGYFWKYKNA